MGDILYQLMCASPMPLQDVLISKWSPVIDSLLDLFEDVILDGLLLSPSPNNNRSKGLFCMPLKFLMSLYVE